MEGLTISREPGRLLVVLDRGCGSKSYRYGIALPEWKDDPSRPSEADVNALLPDINYWVAGMRRAPRQLKNNQ